MTATTTSSPCVSFTLVMLLLAMSAVHVHGWVSKSNNFRGVTPSSTCIGNLVSNEKYLPRYDSMPSPTSLFAEAIEDQEEEVLEYLDDDDDDDDDDDADDEDDDFGANYDPIKASETQARWMSELQRLADTTSGDPSAVADAQEIFDDMFHAYVATDDATFFPTVEVYNLMLETMAYSKSPDGGLEAERILGRMEDPENDFVAKPNEETYLCVMDAWAMRKQPEKANAILDHMETPTVNAHNKMILAYGIAGDFEKAESTFRSLQSEGTPSINHKSWVQLMKARASCGDDNAEDTIRSYFDEMEEAGLEPETDAYNVLIRSMGKKPKGPQKAEAMLFEMIERFRSGSDGDSNVNANVKPNSGTFRAVLTAYNGRGKKFSTASIAAKVEQIMQFREGLLSPEESSLDERTYRIALGIIGRSKDSRKAVRADRIFRKYQHGATTLYLNYLVLEACATTDGNSEEKFAAFQVALGILKDLRSSESDPDAGIHIESSVTGMFLKACNTLLPAGSKRDGVAKQVFQECCAKGLVNDFVLQEFEDVSSETLQLEVLGGFSVDGFQTPDGWSENVVVA